MKSIILKQNPLKKTRHKRLTRNPRSKNRKLCDKAGIGLTTRRLEVALRAFDEATVLDPQLIQAWIMMIRIHDAMGNQAAARETADLALELTPENVELNLMRSDLHQ